MAHIPSNRICAGSQNRFDPVQRTGGLHLTQPVFCMVFHASTALWRSIRRRVCGTGGRGGTHR